MWSTRSAQLQTGHLSLTATVKNLTEHRDKETTGAPSRKLHASLPDHIPTAAKLIHRGFKTFLRLELSAINSPPQKSLEVAPECDIVRDAASTRKLRAHMDKNPPARNSHSARPRATHGSAAITHSSARKCLHVLLLHESAGCPSTPQPRRR